MYETQVNTVLSININNNVINSSVTFTFTVPLSLQQTSTVCHTEAAATVGQSSSCVRACVRVCVCAITVSLLTIMIMIMSDDWMI